MPSVINAVKDTLQQGAPSESILAVKFIKEGMLSRKALFVEAVDRLGLLEMYGRVCRFRKESGIMQRGQHMYIERGCQQVNQSCLTTTSISTRQPQLHCYASSTKTLEQQGHTLLTLCLESVLLWACQHSGVY